MWNSSLHNLAGRMKKGDRNAAGLIYDALLPEVYGFFLADTGEERVAEDLSQQALMMLVERVGEFNEKEIPFTTWFCQLVEETMIAHQLQRQGVAFSVLEEERVA